MSTKKPLLEQPSVAVFYSREQGAQLRICGWYRGIQVSIPPEQAAFILPPEELSALLQSAKGEIPKVL